MPLGVPGAPLGSAWGLSRDPACKKCRFRRQNGHFGDTFGGQNGAKKLFKKTFFSAHFWTTVLIDFGVNFDIICDICCSILKKVDKSANLRFLTTVHTKTMFMMSKVTKFVQTRSKRILNCVRFRRCFCLFFWARVESKRGQNELKQDTNTYQHKHRTKYTFRDRTARNVPHKSGRGGTPEALIIKKLYEKI